MSDALRAAAKRITVFFCDSDGVVFPNTVLMGAPYKAKHRSYYDGQGISLLRAIGIRVVFITNEKGQGADAIRETVEKLNSLPSSKSAANPSGWEHAVLFEGKGGLQKLSTAEEYLKQSGLSMEDTAFMGDDLIDAALLKAVALPAAPAQAEKKIRDMCLFVAEREGGNGAVRDFANMVLEVRGIDPLSLPLQ